MGVKRVGTNGHTGVRRSGWWLRPESQRPFLRSGVSVASRGEMEIASGNANTHDFFEKASLKRYAGASVADSDSADLAETAY